MQCDAVRVAVYPLSEPSWASCNSARRTCRLWEPQCSVSGGSGPSEKVFNEFWKPSRGRLGPRRGRKLLDDHKAVDFSLQVGF
jgi:hypothetical protein